MYWTKERCREDALKYKTKSEWRKNSGSASVLARKNGWLEECCSHMQSPQKPKGYWTLERCREDASKYNTRSEWQEKSKAAYGKARKNNWLSQCCTHMEEPHKPNNYWTKEKLIEDAQKYSTRVGWKNASQSAYALACAQGYLEECCAHMKRMVKPSGYWTLERCKEDALKHKTKSSWQKEPSSGYNSALKNGWVDECCTHMEIAGNRVKRALYAFEHPDNTVYVGLTYNYDKRYSGHMSKNKLLIEKFNQGGQIFKKFNVWYPAEIAGQKEAELIEEYKNNGWTVLNKAKAGGLGGNVLKWTKEAILEEALKYNTIKDFSDKSSGAYSAASNLKILNEVCSHMTRLIHKDYTVEEIKNIALGCKTKSEFQEKHTGAANAARKLSIFEEVCSHMPKNVSGEAHGHYKWTYEMLKNEALKYTNRGDFFLNSKKAYNIAHQRGILDEVCSHMEPTRWTIDEIKIEAAKYQNRSQFRKGNSPAWKAAYRRGLLNELYPKKKG